MKCLASGKIHFKRSEMHPSPRRFAKPKKSNNEHPTGSSLVFLHLPLLLLHVSLAMIPGWRREIWINDHLHARVGLCWPVAVSTLSTTTQLLFFLPEFIIIIIVLLYSLFMVGRETKSNEKENPSSLSLSSYLSMGGRQRSDARSTKNSMNGECRTKKMYNANCKWRKMRKRKSARNDYTHTPCTRMQNTKWVRADECTFIQARARINEEAKMQKWRERHTAYGKQITNNCFHLINLWLWCTNKNVNCNFQLYDPSSCGCLLTCLPHCVLLLEWAAPCT